MYQEFAFRSDFGFLKIFDESITSDYNTVLLSIIYP
jgi:hypothetical protein